MDSFKMTSKQEKLIYYAIFSKSIGSTQPEQFLSTLINNPNISNSLKPEKDQSWPIIFVDTTAKMVHYNNKSTAISGFDKELYFNKKDEIIQYALNNLQDKTLNLSGTFKKQSFYNFQSQLQTILFILGVWSQMDKREVSFINLSNNSIKFPIKLSFRVLYPKLQKIDYSNNLFKEIKELDTCYKGIFLIGVKVFKTASATTNQDNQSNSTQNKQQILPEGFQLTTSQQTQQIISQQFQSQTPQQYPSQQSQQFPFQQFQSQKPQQNPSQQSQQFPFQQSQQFLSQQSKLFPYQPMPPQQSQQMPPQQSQQMQPQQSQQMQPQQSQQMPPQISTQLSQPELAQPTTFSPGPFPPYPDFLLPQMPNQNVSEFQIPTFAPSPEFTLSQQIPKFEEEEEEEEEEEGAEKENEAENAEEEEIDEEEDYYISPFVNSAGDQSSKFATFQLQDTSSFYRYNPSEIAKPKFKRKQLKEPFYSRPQQPTSLSNFEPLHLDVNAFPTHEFVSSFFYDSWQNIENIQNYYNYNSIFSISVHMKDDIDEEDSPSLFFFNRFAHNMIIPNDNIAIGAVNILRAQKDFLFTSGFRAVPTSCSFIQIAEDLFSYVFHGAFEADFIDDFNQLNDDFKNHKRVKEILLFDRTMVIQMRDMRYFISNDNLLIHMVTY